MPDQTPKISIIITCFNYARYVAGAIECALGQTYPNKEVVVVNDGSTDGSSEVIARYADRITLVDQPNMGSIAAYNNGFAASTGQIVIFLDADDLLQRDALARVAERWTPACAKVQYDLEIIDSEGQSLGRRFCNFDRDYDAARVQEAFRRTGTYRWPVTVGNAYSRWFAEQVFPLRTLFPDGTLNTIAPVYGEVVTIADALGSYRIHSNNLWSSGGSDLERLPRRIADRLAEFALMQEHARARGVPVPPGNALDHEIAFINYRLMARKLRMPYTGDRADSAGQLLVSAFGVLRAEQYPLKLSLAHGAWFGLLSVAPAAAARGMIRLRFKRHTVGAPVRNALRVLRALPRPRWLSREPMARP